MELRSGLFFQIKLQVFFGPFLKGSRLRLSVDNIFDAQRKITDGNGIVPLNYQPGYIDPLGRYIELEWRKTF